MALPFFVNRRSHHQRKSLRGRVSFPVASKSIAWLLGCLGAWSCHQLLAPPSFGGSEGAAQRYVLPFVSPFERCGSSWSRSLRSPVLRSCGPEDADVDPEQGVSRIERIHAAIRRGEERAARLAAGEGEPDEQPRQLTAEEDQALKSLFVQPDEEEPIDADFEEQLAATSREYRINRTLEFCPDGVLAREILREMCSNGTAPGVRAWNAVIDALGQRGELDDALDVFKEMQAALVAADDVTYDVLARPAMRRGEFRFVETLYGAKASGRGGSIGAESLAVLLNAYANGRPPQSERAAVAFRNEVDLAKEEGIAVTTAATREVLIALRRATGINQTCELCWEYGVDPAGML